MQAESDTHATKSGAHGGNCLSWPLILAGPVLRRVDLAYRADNSDPPIQLMSVWLALREAATITLSVFTGRKQVGSSGGVAPTTGAIASVTAQTIRIGEQLHLAQVTYKSQPTQSPMVAGQLYSYNIGITASRGLQDLRSLGLLADSTGVVPQKALGYGEGYLPSFATIPPGLQDLRLIHGSCRKMQGEGRDCMEAVDQLIAVNPDDVHRPHQLFLTGDQIYADDVSIRFLPWLSRAGGRLLYGDQYGADLTQPATTLEQLPVAGHSYACDQTNFPTGRRQWLCDNEALFSTTDGDSHLFGFGEFCAMYLCMYANAIWPAWPPAAADLAAQRAAIVAGPANASPIPPGIAKLSDETLAKVTSHFDNDENRTLANLWAALPSCRRALANVPSYMILDDHEVTDDFYLSGLWRRRVLGSPLGRAILRNAQVAYGLFQGWGNDPVAFEKDAGAGFLQQAQELFPSGGASGPAAGAVTSIESLLGMSDPQADSRVEWSYVVDGPKHRVIVLDGRTHRGYDGLYTSPRILDYAALLAQIPGDPPPAGEPDPLAGNGDPLPSGFEVAVVVAPAPVLGIAVMEELVEPGHTRLFDILNITQRGETGGLYENDAEAWAFNPNGFEGLLRRLAKLQRVVLLSGDLHFGFTTSLAYWQKTPQGDLAPQATFAQLVSSAVKNVSGHPPLQFWMLNTSMFQFLLGRALFPIEKVGFLRHTPSPVTLPAGKTPPFKARLALEKDPTILSTSGWPAGTTSVTPDWAWRMKGLARDERPDAQRPSEAQPTPLASDVNVSSRAGMLAAYNAVAARHQSAMRANAPRRVVWGSNVGLVSFLVSGNSISVQHALHSFHEPLDAADTVPADSQAQPFTVHVVSLDLPAATDKPPTVTPPPPGSP